MAAYYLGDQYLPDVDKTRKQVLQKCEKCISAPGWFEYTDKDIREMRFDGEISWDDFLCLVEAHIKNYHHDHCATVKIKCPFCGGTGEVYCYE